MLLQTPNLILRFYQSDDVERILPILSDATTMQFWPSPFTAEAAGAWVARNIESYDQYGFGRYPIILRPTGDLIGDCGLLRLTVDGELVNDIGYIVHHPYWGRGYATEAATAVRDHAFDQLKLDTLHANMPWNHHASRRVAEKLGMRKIKEFYNQRNQNILTLLYALSNELS